MNHCENAMDLAGRDRLRLDRKMIAKGNYRSFKFRLTPEASAPMDLLRDSAHPHAELSDIVELHHLRG
jgi:hypothetical protein